VKLVWHADDLIEGDWLRDIFGSLIDSEVIDLDLTCFDDDTIHVVSINWRPLSGYEAYFRECRARCKHIVLFHASDEWFCGGYSLYRYFDLVIRNFQTYLARDAGILTIPEGYPDHTRIGPTLPADKRRWVWSFSGQIKASRVAMHTALRGFAPNFVSRTNMDGKKLTKAEYDALLGETVFSPCPMGNVVIETWRLYESLELGCIPLVETRVSLDYYGRLFGPNPIPAFDNWPQARRYAENLFSDRPGLLLKQNELRKWWTAQKAKLRVEVQTALTGPSHAASLETYAGLIRNRFSVVYGPLRLIELMRHQTAGSFARRLARPVGPIKRIIKDVAKASPLNTKWSGW
jgi:hypothetical protein